MAPAPTAGMTRLGMETRASYEGIWWLLEPLISSAAQRRLDEDVARLKTKLERAPPR